MKPSRIWEGPQTVKRIKRCRRSCNHALLTKKIVENDIERCYYKYYLGRNRKETLRLEVPSLEISGMADLCKKNHTYRLVQLKAYAIRTNDVIDELLATRRPNNSTG